MTTIARPAAGAGGGGGGGGALATAWARVWRARRLVERNIMVYRHQWLIILSGVFEPIFYLIGIGLGLGAIIDTVTLPTDEWCPTRRSSPPPSWPPRP